MSLITSPEFLINMKSVPQRGDSDYEAFLRYEMEKLNYGVTISGVYIPNWLYWHLNYWKAVLPDIDLRSGEVRDKTKNPTLRDNEWLLAENIERAKKEKKGIIIIGGRRIAKTSFVASWLSLHASIFEGSQNVIVGNNKGDIRNITVLMDLGLNKVPDYIKFNRILNDWKSEVELGWKLPNGERLSYSHIYIKNTEDGNSTEILAGLTPKTLVYDEVGKASIKAAFIAGMPAFGSEYGWRCVPILTGTGGDFTNGKDAEEMFHNPDRYNLLAIEVPKERRYTGLFIPGNYATDYPKIESNLAEYLHKEGYSELNEIAMRVTNFELSNKIIDDKLALAKQSNDNTEYLKMLMYIPRNVDECFLSNVDENPFPVEALKQHRDWLIRSKTPLYVKLHKKAEGGIGYIITDQRPISEYPVKKDTNKKAPVVIYEEPIPNAPSYLYIGGSDPYNTDQSNNSPSLGTLYIYKRVYNPVSGTYQRRIVASYTARPDKMNEWHETAEMLLELYNATVMVENIGTNFIQYMENKNKAHYLADGYNLAKEISPNYSGKGIKGLPPTPGVQSHYRGLIKQYLTEDIVIGTNPDGTKQTILGLTRIDDVMLLTEFIEYRETEFKRGGGNKKKGNFDRYVSFGHVLVYEQYLDKIVPYVKVEEEVKETEKKNEHTFSGHNPFKSSHNPFGIEISKSPFHLK